MLHTARNILHAEHAWGHATSARRDSGQSTAGMENACTLQKAVTLTAGQHSWQLALWLAC